MNPENTYEIQPNYNMVERPITKLFFKPSNILAYPGI